MMFRFLGLRRSGVELGRRGFVWVVDGMGQGSVWIGRERGWVVYLVEP